MVCAAGSLPGDLHKLWRARHPKHYHLEYGYSCMGYEIAGGLGVKMAAPEREVYVMVGDGSYLMMSQRDRHLDPGGLQADHRAARQQRLQEHRQRSAARWARQGFGTRYVYPQDGVLPGDEAERGRAAAGRPGRQRRAAWARTSSDCATYDDFVAALQAASDIDRTTVIYIQNDRLLGVPGYESWWDVPVAEVSEMPSVRQAREEWEAMRAKERYFL